MGAHHLAWAVCYWANPRHHRDFGDRLQRDDRIDHIEEEVNKIKVPASFADQFYVLRGHIDFVRERLTRNAQFQKDSPRKDA